MWSWYYSHVSELRWRVRRMGNAVAHFFGYKLMKRSVWEALPLYERVTVARSGVKLVD